MIRHEDLKDIAVTRLKEARVLYQKAMYDGAGYLCGYVVETALKARICKNLRIKEYPDEGKDKSIFSSHDFDRLLLLSGLQSKINLGHKKNKVLFANWSLLTSWRPERRYKLGEFTKADVEELFKALEGSPQSFLTWIKKLW